MLASVPEHEPGSLAMMGVESLPMNSRVGEFEIIGIIGEGGFGTVYLAIDHSLQRRVALKEYRPAALATRQNGKVVTRSARHAEAFEAGLKSFVNEARTLAQFDHPALIRVYRFWQQDNTAYMAMPLCEGRTLTQVVNDEPEFITEAWLKSILAPLLDAIEALHSVHIFHRDIAPDNVFIQENGAPILLDFGAARQIVSDMTQALTVILKPGYAPIEQYAEDASMKQGPWTDIYALGAVIYFALTRKAPPNSVTRLVNDTYQPLVKVLGTSYSEGFLAAVDAALVIRPEGRPQTIDAMRELLGLPRITPPPKTQLNPRASSPAHRTGSLTNSVPTITDADATMIVPRKTAAPASGVTLSPALAAQEAPSAPDVPAPVTAAPASPAPARRKEGMGTVALIAVGVAILVAGALVTFWRINSQPAAGLRADSETAVKSEAAKPSEAVAPAPQAGVVAPVSTAAAPSAPAPSPVAQPALPAGAKAAEAAAASAIGTLQIAVKPWGEVLVDGGSKGVSPPLKQLKLAAGKHKVEFANPGFPSYATEIEIQKGRSVTVSYQFK